MASDRVIRVAYWMNSDNPIGASLPINQGIHFSGSVGYGPDPSGKTMQPCMLADVKWPTRLIALADGLYAGRQQATRLGIPNSRVGYRHPGRAPTANVAFADGHVASLVSDEFPRKSGAGLSLEDVRRENLGPNATVYSDPERYLLP